MMWNLISLIEEKEVLERFLGDACNFKELSPLTLAFIGDSVFDILVREHLICTVRKPVKILNELKVERVCCKAQAKAAEKLLPIFTEEELSIFKRGRNARVSSVPKNASVADYHAATGLEALFGFLYLKGETARLHAIFKICLETYESLPDDV